MLPPCFWREPGGEIRPERVCYLACYTAVPGIRHWCEVDGRTLLSVRERETKMTLITPYLVHWLFGLGLGPLDDVLVRPGPATVLTTIVKSPQTQEPLYLLALTLPLTFPVSPRMTEPGIRAYRRFEYTTTINTNCTYCRREH